MLRIYLFKFCAYEAILLIPGDRAVEDRLAGIALRTNQRRILRLVGRIQRMALHTGNQNQVAIRLEAGRHRPENILHIEAVYIFIHKEYMLQLCE